ncbi:Zinc finger, RING/FYVE/PHD-type [Quillaja saponaria]|uniref:Zinc finger, RING/FYVE/PHD-type n=1 Tax=Quillaja saponaria TaxID=32244 RepID=A0AAD7PD30_QUISA|nr:Zinc finger, RING/FYVE/PHD-type [Quillaja saponaria]
MAGVKRRLYTDSDTHAFHKELDEVSCPICMDHPHNAVLLICSSHEKGCRSYICDSSYRHSNCLDRLKKIRDDVRDPTFPNSLPINANSSNSSDLNLGVRSNLNGANESDQNEINTVLSVGLPQGSTQGGDHDLNRQLHSHHETILETVDSETLRERVDLEELDMDTPESKLSLKCPLCRGTVLGWEIVEEARNYLNLKNRSCSRDSCSFVGNYLELRRHARRVHPTTRPSDIDPSRERAWRHLERQREYADIVSAIRSAVPGAMVVGDYVIENGDGRLPGEREGGTGESRPWWATLFLFQMIDSVREPRQRSRVWTRPRRLAGGPSERRYLWGENLLGLYDDDDDDDNDNDDLRIINDMGQDSSSVPRRRRRLTRSRSHEDQP